MPPGLGVTPQPSHASNVTKRQANEEVAMDKAEGKMKEAYGALVGDEAKKAEGRALQRKAEAEAEAEQRGRTRRAEAEAKKAERERDKQEGKGGLGNILPKL